MWRSHSESELREDSWTSALRSGGLSEVGQEVLPSWYLSLWMPPSCCPHCVVLASGGLRPKPLSVCLLPWIRKIRLLNQRSRIWAKPLEMARTWGQLSIFFLCLCKIKRVLFYFWWWELEKVTALTAWLTGLLINHELREGKGLACSHTAVRVESCLLVHPAFSSCPYSRHPHPSLKS